MIDLVKKTTILSVIVQVITGLVDLIVVFVKLPAKHLILNRILLLETIVQFIEFGFYVWFVKSFANRTLSLSTMAATRYFDWVITTPTMLFTTMVFMKYQEMLESKQDTSKLTIREFVSDNKENIMLVVFANFFMLLFGYFGEIGMIDRTTALLVGFAFFAVVFAIIWKDYGSKSEQGKKLYIFFLIVWGLYGVAYTFPAAQKNIGLNMLDIVAKNFFGVYLVYIIFKTVSLHQ